MTFNEIFETLSRGVVLLEGPYKWYAVGVIVLILTAGITRFIFKTLKWFLIVVMTAAIVAGAVWSLISAADLKVNVQQEINSMSHTLNTAT